MSTIVPSSFVHSSEMPLITTGLLRRGDAHPVLVLHPDMVHSTTCTASVRHTREVAKTLESNAPSTAS